MTYRTLARRRGFTLVELLVVVALLAVLVALSTGAYFRIRASELVRATEATESKLNMLLDKRWSAIRAQAADDANATTAASRAVLTFAGNDKDRARVIMTYLKFKNEFPTTIAEACTPITVNGVIVYAPRSVFTSQFGGIGATGTGSPDESAALFYLAITSTGNRGETAGSDGTQQQIGNANITYTPPPSGNAQTSKSMAVYADAWGNPIMFLRQTYTSELNGPPYARTIKPGIMNCLDVADPTGRLIMPTNGWTIAPPLPASSSLSNFWGLVSSNHIAYPWSPPNAPAGTQFPNGFPTGYPYQMDATTKTTITWNWVSTLISAGPNKNIVKPANGGTGNPWDPSSPDGLFGGDNIVSYRLRREGNRGE